MTAAANGQFALHGPVQKTYRGEHLSFVLLQIIRRRAFALAAISKLPSNFMSLHDDSVPI